MSEVKRNYPGRGEEKDNREQLLNPGRHIGKDHIPYVLDNNEEDLAEEAQRLVGHARRATDAFDGAEAAVQERHAEAERRGARELGSKVFDALELEDNSKLVELHRERKDRMDAATWRAYEHYRDNPAAYHQAALDEDDERTIAEYQAFSEEEKQRILNNR